MNDRNIKILFTTPVLEHPPAGGPMLRIENSIKALNQISELHVVSRCSKKAIGGEEAGKFYSNICQKFSYIPAQQEGRSWLEKLAKYRLPLRNRYVNFALNFPLKILFRLLITNEVDYLIDYYDANKIDVLWFGYGNISYDMMRTIKARRPDIKIVCDTDSVWSRFILRELSYETDPKRRKKIEKNGKKKEKEEINWVNFCDVTTAVSEVDAEYYKQLAKDQKRIKLFSNVIDLDTYKNKPPKANNMKNPCIYIAGTFWPKSPMEKATRWVLEKVLPIVKKEISNIHFYIIGKGSDTTFSDVKDDYITATGKLDSVLPYLYYADVSLVPLTFESGTRFKILEAAACGIPIVSTTLGAEGLNVVSGQDILTADEPETFAHAIIMLLRDKEYARSIANKCKNLVEQNYSINTLIKEAKEIFAFLGV